ncbi:MAG: molybdenum cofactor biosynthesis protein MoaE [Chitinophagaceae bacterium]|nr:molybdenum cofactor biosynthesis protein MoaE [Chitinophagaceae bacterium]
MIPLQSYHPVAEDSSNHISAAPLDPVALISLAHHPKAGAIVLFSGEVRDSNLGKQVTHLEYEAHVSMASKMIAAILKEATSRWYLNIAIAQHRTGKLEVGESAVIVVTGSAHRKEAYAANRFIIDKIKHEVPIWKCEYLADGTKEWGGNCNCGVVNGEW